MAKNKIEFAGKVILDLTADTVTPETLAEGVTAHDRSGEQIVGTMVGGSGASVTAIGTSSGTAVPTSGYVDKIYFNTKLSNDEVNSTIQAYVDANPENASWYDGQLDVCISAGFSTTITVCNFFLAGMYIIRILDKSGETNIYDSTQGGWLYTDEQLTELGLNPYVFNNVNALEAEHTDLNRPLMKGADLIANLVSITPFVSEITIPLEGEYDGSPITAEGSTIDVKELLDEKKLPLTINTGGGSVKVTTPAGVPVIGTWDGVSEPTAEQIVSGIYFNTSLSVEEVNEILSKLTYSDGQPILSEMWIDVTSVTPDVIGIYKYDDGYEIFTMSSGIFNSSPSNENANFIGWNPEFSGMLQGSFLMAAPETDMTEAGFTIVDNQQEMYANLISLSPNFEPKEITLSGDYDGSGVTVTENGIVDIEAMLSEKKLPLSVEVTIEASGGGSGKLVDVVSRSVTEITAQDLQGCTYIGKQAFYNCHSLTSVELPDGVTEISDGAFQNCYSLQSVTIPSSVKYIEEYAFSTCYDLTNITFKGTTQQWNSITKRTYWNSNINGNCMVYCTDGTVSATGSLPS